MLDTIMDIEALRLMVELRREDHSSFTNFMHMSPEMYDEILERVRGRLTKQHTFFPRALRTWPETGGDTVTFGLWI